MHDAVRGRNAVPCTGARRPEPAVLDNELLDAHYIAGDGRANENIGLTAVHKVFHYEHNRLVEQTNDLIRAELANGNARSPNWVLAGANLRRWHSGERVERRSAVPAAKFGTETQYQHLVFEEFARKIAPTIHLFGNTPISISTPRSSPSLPMPSTASATPCSTRTCSDLPAQSRRHAGYWA